MNRTQKFSLNALAAAVNQCIIMIAGFITPAIMIGTYGSEVNGLVSSINHIIAYLSLVEAGLSGAAVYSLYKPLATNDIRGINGIVAAAKKYYIKAGYIFSTAAFIMAVVLAATRSSAAVSGRLVFGLALLLSANGCVDFFVLARYRTLLTADQKTYVISFISVFQTISKTLIIVFCASVNTSIILLYIFALIPIGVKIVYLSVYAKKKYPYLDYDETPNEKALGRRYDVVYQQILGTVQSGAPTLIASIFLNWTAVSVFSVYNMVLNGINGVLSIFVSGLPAGFGDVMARGEKETLRKTAAQFEVAYYALLSIVYGLTLALILPFISIYTRNFTDTQYYVPSIAILIVLNGIAYSIKTPQSMLMISAGLYKEQRWRATFQAAIILIGGSVLVRYYGINGILVASIISNLYRTVDLVIYVPRNITNNPMWQSVKRMLQAIINIAIIAVPSFVARQKCNGYLNWFLMAVCYGVYALIVTSLSFYVTERKECRLICKRIQNVMFRR